MFQILWLCGAEIKSEHTHLTESSIEFSDEFWLWLQQNPFCFPKLRFYLKGIKYYNLDLVRVKLTFVALDIYI